MAVTFAAWIVKAVLWQPPDKLYIFPTQLYYVAHTAKVKGVYSN